MYGLIAVLAFVVVFGIVIGLWTFLPSTKKEKKKDTFVSCPEPEGFENTSSCVFFVNRTKVPLSFGGETISPKEEKRVCLGETQNSLVYLGEIPFLKFPKHFLKRGKIFLGSSTTLDVIYDDLNGFLPVMDIPVLRIHNLTLVPLVFGNVSVPPMTTIEYKGTEGNGISFGAVLQDSNGIFEPVVVQKRISDVYFGIVSNLLPSTFSTQRYY